MSSFFIYGPPGTGKTTLGATFAKLGYHPHFIDIDRKVPTMKNLEPLVQSGKLSYTQLESGFLEDKLTTRVKMGPKAQIPKMPKGYTELTEMIDKLQNGELLANMPQNIDPRQIVLILDGMTRASQHMRRLLRWFKKGADTTFHDWDFVKLNYEELLDAIYSLQPKPFSHCVIIAHAQDEKDELLGAIKEVPIMDGSTRYHASGFVEECYYTSVKVTGNKVDFQIQTKPSGRIQQARSSRNIDVFMPADMSIILKGENYVPIPK